MRDYLTIQIFTRKEFKESDFNLNPEDETFVVSSNVLFYRDDEHQMICKTEFYDNWKATSNNCYRTVFVFDTSECKYLTWAEIYDEVDPAVANKTAYTVLNSLCDIKDVTKTNIIYK